MIENADQGERTFQTVTLWRISGMRTCMCILMTMNDTCVRIVRNAIQLINLYIEDFTWINAFRHQ